MVVRVTRVESTAARRVKTSCCWLVSSLLLLLNQSILNKVPKTKLGPDAGH